MASGGELSDVSANLAMDESIRCRKYELVEFGVTHIIHSAMNHGLIETSIDDDGLMYQVAKLTSIGDMGSVEGGVNVTADRLTTVSAMFTMDGEYLGVDIDMTEYDKGKYLLEPNGDITREDGKRLNKIGRRNMYRKLRKYHLV